MSADSSSRLLSITLLTDPFRHVVIDGAFTPSLVRAASLSFPRNDWEHWHRYDSGDAVKLATRDRGRIPPACLALIDAMCALPVESVFPVGRVFPDYECYGAGMHVIPPEGRLGMHVDAAHHPQLPWQRKLSAVLMLNEGWLPVWGGALVLQDNGHTVQIPTEFNRLVIFESGPTSWHGVPDAVQCPEYERRKTLAVFWWTESADRNGHTQAKFARSGPS